MLGIDEAGRGPAIGPMVVAGARISAKDAMMLKKIGVRDSKEVPPKERSELAEKIKKVAVWTKTVSLSAKEIDERMKRISLNDIELEAMAELINACDLPDGEEVIIDLPSKSPEFGMTLRARLKNKKVKLTLEHAADKNHVCVGAASILAKEERENAIEKLHRVYGDFGSGYPHDPKTREFLERLMKEKKPFPDVVRSGWATIKDMQVSAAQKKLF